MAQVTNKVIQILQTRDGMRQEDAIDFYNYVMDNIFTLIGYGEWEEAEDLFEEEFGLEIDYLIELI